MTILSIADGVVVQDIIDDLPKHATKKYRIRDTNEIERIYIHHSGRLGRSGIDGAINSTKYCVNHRDWAGAPYHYWIPHAPVLHGFEDEDLMMFQMQPHNIRCYHTGGVCNTHGLGVALQGNTSTNGISDFQIECLEALIPHLAELCDLPYEAVGMHNEAMRWGGPRNKRSCPGKGATAWVREWRGDSE